MKNKIVKRVIIIAIIAAVAAGGIGGGVSYQKNNRTANVTLVSNISDSYWGDEIYSSGKITNDYSQSVYLGNEDSIMEVFVEEGQTVQAGDKLLSLDVSTSELDFKMKELEVENLENQIAITQNDLKKWKKTKPSSGQTPIVDPSPTVQRGPEKTGQAYNYILPTAVPYNQSTADGSFDNPYRYLCTSNAYITGEAIGALADSESCAVFEIYPNNVISGEPSTSWMIDGRHVAIPDADSCWSVAARTQVDVETESEEEMDIPEDSGYTQAEINEQISECEEKLKELDLSKRKAELEVEKMKAKSTDGIIYATVSGTIKNLQEIDNRADDKPFLEISGTEGLYVTGSISELLMDQVQPGQRVQVSSWESGTSCEAEIQEIHRYPTTDGYAYSGDGNTNVSYYPFTAKIDDTTGLRNGEYVDLSMTFSGEDGSDTIYLSKAYVRTDGKCSYVFKADENDRLVKQYVQTGKTIYGQSIEIKSGLTLEDRIAFPYGKTAKEGIRVVDSDEMNW